MPEGALILARHLVCSEWRVKCYANESKISKVPQYVYISYVFDSSTAFCSWSGGVWGSLSRRTRSNIQQRSRNCNIRFLSSKALKYKERDVHSSIHLFAVIF